ncbi:VirB4 family type IV secretion system protein [Staphylococcus xylosus]|uniref:VirB4 family type IV secretion system protein n=1 Tax=Staphylococcus xylosus TaxID=1288 RepID=UPI00403ECC52
MKLLKKKSKQSTEQTSTTEEQKLEKERIERKKRNSLTRKLLPQKAREKLELSKDEKEVRKTTNESFPIKDIFENGVCMTHDKRYRMVFKVIDPISLDLLSNEEIVDVIIRLQDAVNTLDIDNRMQILLSNEYVDMTKYRKYLDGLPQEEQNEVVNKSIEDYKNYTDYLSYGHEKSRAFYFSIESKHKKIKDAEQELFNKKSQIINLLQASGTRAIQLYKDTIRRMCYRKTNDNSVQAYESNMTLDEIAPNEIINRNNEFLIANNEYISTYTLTHIQSPVSMAWLNKLQNSDLDLDISISFEPVYKHELTQMVEEQLAVEEGNASNERLGKASMRRADDRIEELSSFLDNINDESENLTRTTILLFVKAQSEEELYDSEIKLDNLLKESKFRGQRLRFLPNNTYYYTLPLCHKEHTVEDYMYYPLTALNLASLIPFNSSELNYQEGVVAGLNGVTGAPVIYNRLNSNIFDNPSEVVLGTSGSGKSFYVTRHAWRHRVCTDVSRIFMIDIEREYNKMPDSRRMILKAGGSTVVNPFNIRSSVVDADKNSEDESTLGDYLRRKLALLMNFFEWIYDDMNTSEKGALQTVITEIYKMYNIDFHTKALKDNQQFPTMSDLKNKIIENDETSDTLKDFLKAIEPYVTGTYATLFNGQTNYNYDSPINVVDIHELDPDVQKPVFDIILQELWEEIKKDRNERVGLYVDEAWYLSDEKHQQTMEFLRNIAKRIRKYGGYCVTITQEVDDFISTGKYGKSIVKNAFVKTLFQLTEDDIMQLEKFMVLSEAEKRRILKGTKKGEAVQLVGKKKIMLDVDYTEYETEVLGLSISQEIDTEEYLQSM